MARPLGLSRNAKRWLLALAAVVLVGHAVALHWLSRWQAETRLLRPMVAPLYTRVLQPEPPAAVAQVAPPPAAPTVPSGRLRASSGKPKAPPATPAASAPQAVDPPPVAAAPTPAASEPVVVAEPAAPPPAAATSDPFPAASAASAPASATDSWPADTRLRYRLGGRFRSGELYGNARVLWQRDGDRYQVRVEVDVTLFASLVLTSQGEVQAGGLVPQVYEEVRRSGVRGVRLGEREVVLANGTVVPRPAGVQDTASQFVELSHRFSTGQERLEVGRAVTFWMARPGGLNLWTYDVVEREMLRTGLGEIEAFHLRPRPVANPRGNITAEMWFAPSLQHLPVRIRVNMGDEAQIDLMVEAIEQK